MSVLSRYTQWPQIWSCTRYEILQRGFLKVIVIFGVYDTIPFLYLGMQLLLTSRGYRIQDGNSTGYDRLISRYRWRVGSFCGGLFSMIYDICRTCRLSLSSTLDSLGWATRGVHITQRSTRLIFGIRICV